MDDEECSDLVRLFCFFRVWGVLGETLKLRDGLGYESQEMAYCFLGVGV